jgi:hypothetical protein
MYIREFRSEISNKKCDTNIKGEKRERERESNQMLYHTFFYRCSIIEVIMYARHINPL